MVSREFNKLSVITESSGQHSDWSQWPVFLLLLHIPPEHRHWQESQGGATGLWKKHKEESWHLVTPTAKDFRGPAGPGGRDSGDGDQDEAAAVWADSPLRVSLPLPECPPGRHQEGPLAPLSVPVREPVRKDKKWGISANGRGKIFVFPL